MCLNKKTKCAQGVFPSIYLLHSKMLTISILNFSCYHTYSSRISLQNDPLIYTKTSHQLLQAYEMSGTFIFKLSPFQKKRIVLGGSSASQCTRNSKNRLRTHPLKSLKGTISMQAHSFSEVKTMACSAIFLIHFQEQGMCVDPGYQCKLADNQSKTFISLQPRLPK